MNILREIRTTWRYRDNPEDAAYLVHVVWYGMLGLVVVSVMLSVLYGSWMLVRVFAIAGAPANGGAVSETLSREELSRVLETAAQRQVNYDALVSSPRRVIDPGR